MVRTASSDALRIIISTEVKDRKLYPLMHDLQYRAEVARQQTTYNQPSYTSFYLASDIDWSDVPIPPVHPGRGNGNRDVRACDARPAGRSGDS